MATHVRTLVVLIAVAIVALPLAACVADDSTQPRPASADSTVTEATVSELWNSETVHSISIDYNKDDYDELIQAYLTTGEKEWISANIVIDGKTFENAGIKLKGNSSLRELSTDADADLSSQNPQDLPWLIRLDKYVDGQNLGGTTELVVRGNNSESALNEAVALELLEKAGLASQQAIAVRFAADGSDETLRLVIENPNDSWMERQLGDGLLYKAEAGGDYSYRGDEDDAYADVFDQEGGEDDLDPLIDFLSWVNDSDDATFSTELDDHLDIEAFATYLAFHELIDNFDDIDGPGNNSYLYYDTESALMTVVSWDLNLAFGGGPGNALGGGFPRESGVTSGERGDDGQRLERPNIDSDAVEGDAPGGGLGKSNVLVQKFHADDDFEALYESELDRLRSELFGSGAAMEILDEWSATLRAEVGDLVADDTIVQESEAIAAKIRS